MFPNIFQKKKKKRKKQLYRIYQNLPEFFARQKITHSTLIAHVKMCWGKGAKSEMDNARW